MDLLFKIKVFFKFLLDKFLIKFRIFRKINNLHFYFLKLL